jgi:hypothetical protein
MAVAHGAGLMLWPALMPLCLPGDAGAVPASTPLVVGLAGVGVHTLAMLSVTAATAATVYEWIGLEVLRRAWLNIDALWVTALFGDGHTYALEQILRHAAVIWVVSLRSLWRQHTLKERPATPLSRVGGHHPLQLLADIVLQCALRRDEAAMCPASRFLY